MRTMNRRNFLALAGAGSVAAATSVGADILSPRTAGAYNFRAVAALPTDRRFPEWGSYVVEGYVNPATRSGSISRVVYAGAPDAMSRIALHSHLARVVAVRRQGSLLHVKAMVDDRSRLMRGESPRVHMTIDTRRHRLWTEFYSSRVTLTLE